ncbi:UDP-N-acetylmuramoyl-L-alanine--D-glutamate ligase [Blautia sp. An249]|uniref:UDP-N-acetylmuramoyl-L-alanine--D-glutamate ligase n=1 Tax=Blautia sp. An249 TaxID=1965603 RepID=UPI000B56E72B|nr:UDP-N-acetylmuramoyl-L-alanine--D-glutamate ligase [Blautia sp. An249]OUO80665.1 UDP-N-acetylmuramoyl-L-alanine--D-glutamate ligase [Blautia sp. An249]
MSVDLKNKNVLVFGTGISGIAAADLLGAVGASPILYDGNQEVDKEAVLHKTKGDYPVSIYTGELPGQVLDSLDLAVLSPGVPTDLPLVKEFYQRGIKVWGEVELAYQMGKGKVLAITGTNGKTTTTALLGKITGDYEKSVYVVGNIGTPYTSLALKMQENTVTVAEISSFQLETTETFRPAVSAILNITEDHLNRHHTMEEYIRVKELITKNQQPEDVCVLNYEDEVLREFGASAVPRVVYFSSQRKLESGIYLDGDRILLKPQNEAEIEVVKTKDLKLLGQHNFENVMAAVAMAYYAGIPMESIRKSICEFTAVEHRIEFVLEKDGVAYYNDSKATNPDAAIKGIQAMNRRTLLIGGGYDKESGYEEWIGAFNGKVKYLVLIGQTREKIQKTAHEMGFTKTILADSLEEAVKICAQKAEPGDAVLLSPACASWGQFDNYEQRGRKFKEYVRAL